MKAWIVLIAVVVATWIGLSWSDPLFQAAAEHVCSTHAQDHGWEVVEASGSLGYNRRRYWTPRRFTDHDCVFEDAGGGQVYLDEFDDELTRTWEARGLRLAGWVLVAGPAVAVLACAGALGMLERD